MERRWCDDLFHRMRLYLRPSRSNGQETRLARATSSARERVGHLSPVTMSSAPCRCLPRCRIAWPRVCACTCRSMRSRPSPPPLEGGSPEGEERRPREEERGVHLQPPECGSPPRKPHSVSPAPVKSRPRQTYGEGRGQAPVGLRAGAVAAEARYVERDVARVSVHVEAEVLRGRLREASEKAARCGTLCMPSPRPALPCTAPRRRGGGRGRRLQDTCGTRPGHVHTHI